MKILIIGSGGREHAIAWKIKQSPLCDSLFVAPGNAGTSTIATNLPLDINDFSMISGLIKEHEINLLVIGPEAPLVSGLRDYLEGEPAHSDLLIIGPGRVGATLEGSKVFSKSFMQRYGIPTAGARTFNRENFDEVMPYLNSHTTPIVIKADGLAAGKGVILADSVEEAYRAIHEMLFENKFDKAGNTVLVEECLHGIEVSVFIVTDGTNYVVLPEAKDYKRIGDQDTGPNTGGMGAVSPVPFADQLFLRKVEDQIIQKTLEGLKMENISYQGFMFLGLMNVADDPYVIEYNVRMGDPETQVVLPRIKSDMVEMLLATAQNKLKNFDLEILPDSATTVVGVAGGYPGSYEKGHLIYGLNEEHEGICFHAGTRLSEEGVLTNGGRVLAITGMGANIDESIKTAYSGMNNIDWQDKYYRKDVGQDLLQLT